MNKPPLKGRELFEYLQNLVTESSNPQSEKLDRMPAVEILELINAEDATVALAVRKEIPQIVRAVDLVFEALRNGGRLIYMGAGTSGRLGVLDAAECPPTFGTDPDTIVGLIAGGPPTLIRSAEGVEDDTGAGANDIIKLGVGKNDVVMGLTSSKRTPYVMAGLAKAGELGARTILLCCNPPDEDVTDFDVLIAPIVGPEVLAGSTG